MRNVSPISAIGDLIAVAEERLLRAIAHDQQAFADGIRRTLDAMRAELCAPDAPCTERLLVDQILLSWLEVYSFQLGDEELLRDEKLQRNYDRVMRRYQAAILALARLQKINLAAQRTRAAAVSSSTPPQSRGAAASATPHAVEPAGNDCGYSSQADESTSPPQPPQRPPILAPATLDPANVGYPASKHSHRRSRANMKRCSASLSLDPSQI